MNNISEEGRRRKERIPYDREIIINDMIRAKPSDISEGGLYIQNEVPLAKGDIIEVSLPFKDERLKLKAKVKYHYAKAGVGLMFIDLDDIKKARLRKLIEDLKMESAITAIEQPKILLVEDDNLSRRISKGKLILEGFSVVEAKDGVEAIELLKRQPVDIIVLDLFISKMDGLKVLSIIKASSLWKDIPVIVFSAKGSQEIIDKAISQGVEKFLLKSVTPVERLVEEVKALIKNRESPKNW